MHNWTGYILESACIPFASSTILLDTATDTCIVYEKGDIVMLAYWGSWVEVGGVYYSLLPPSKYAQSLNISNVTNKDVIAEVSS